MQRLFLLVAVMLLSGCLTAPPKEAARPTFNASCSELQRFDPSASADG